MAAGRDGSEQFREESKPGSRLHCQEFGHKPTHLSLVNFVLFAVVISCANAANNFFHCALSISYVNITNLYLLK
jgi:hypothetical protein